MFQLLVYYFDLFLLFVSMYLCDLAYLWRVDKEQFENFQEQEFEESE